MAQVLGIGCVFFRANDPSALAAWYEKHLGINPAPTSEQEMPWVTQEGVTVFSPFAADTDYFPKDRAFMLNFRVADLAVAVKDLNEAGIETGDVLEMEGIGRFSRIHDPEGNPIELWEPPSD